jgi:hypothetical protein
VEITLGLFGMKFTVDREFTELMERLKDLRELRVQKSASNKSLNSDAR